MEDKLGLTNRGSHSSEPANEDQRTEPARARWNPKPEQIFILDSIFNSGLENPSKEETIQIRKHLQKFGSVGDANVFYWFQNRRSRSRRRQRQDQVATSCAQPPSVNAININLPYYEHEHSTTTAMGLTPSLTTTTTTTTTKTFFPSQSATSSSSTSYSVLTHPSSLTGLGGGAPEFGQHNNSKNLIFHPSNSHYQSGVIMVFINGVPTEVPSGPLDMKVVFGEDHFLIHSSGVVVPFNNHGFLVQGLQHGQSYFLVSRAI